MYCRKRGLDKDCCHQIVAHKFTALVYKKTTLIVWWMRPIYELFCATPGKHPKFWGESVEWYTMKN